MRLALVRRAFRDVQLIAGVFLVFCGGALALTAAGIALDYHRAIEVQGILTAKELVRADGEKNRATRFVARYRVALPGGGTHEAEEDLPREVWESRQVGATHPVLYLPSERRALKPGRGERESAAIMGLIGLGLLIGGTLAARRPAARLVARLQTIRRGVPADATVLDVWQTSTAVNRVILWQLRYKYRDASGAEHEAESELLWPTEAERWGAGASAAVLYDEAHPGNSVWLGRAPGEMPAPAPSLAALPLNAARAAWPWVRNLGLFFIALFAAAVIAELFPALKAFDAWIETRRGELLVLTLGASVGGIFTLVGAVIALLMARGEPMDRTGVENHLRSMRDAQNLPSAWRASSYRLFGRGSGVSGHDEFKLADFRRAIASGAVLHEPLWRRRAFAALGALLILLGISGTLIVVTPLALKLLLAAGVLYTLLMIGRGFVRA